jgi:hypothetical protein
MTGATESLEADVNLENLADQVLPAVLASLVVAVILGSAAAVRRKWRAWARGEFHNVVTWV